MTYFVLAALSLLLPYHGATQSWDDISKQAGLIAVQSAPVVDGGIGGFVPLDMRPSATAPTFLVGSLGAGLQQGGVPCITCVKKVQTKDNIGLTGPEGYVPTGATWQYTLSITDVTFVGTCQLSWAITAGSRVLDKFASPKITVKGGGYVLYGLGRARPSYSGPAIITGKAQCGALSQTTAMSLYFQ